MAKIGQQLGEHVLEEMIGRGTFGEVWRARHHAWSDRVVAVKIPTDTAYIANLQREGSAIGALHHPNIVSALNFFPYGDPPYLVMEYVDGPSLRELLRRRAKLPLDQTITILTQVLRALGHAHAKGVVHRDVKPENVLLTAEGVRVGFVNAPDAVKLTDFGLGMKRAGGEQSIIMSASLNGAEGARIAGSLDYMAPEVRQEGAGGADARSDLYACGVMLYEMLTGERPAGFELPSARQPTVPGWIDEAFKRAYVRRDKRFASAEEFAAALRPAAAAPGNPAPAGPSRPAGTRMTPQRQFASPDEAREMVLKAAAKFIHEQGPSWDHQGWLGFLAGVRSRVPASVLADAEVGRLLEATAARLRQRRTEAAVNPPPTVQTVPPAAPARTIPSAPSKPRRPLSPILRKLVKPALAAGVIFGIVKVILFFTLTYQSYSGSWENWHMDGTAEHDTFSGHGKVIDRRADGTLVLLVSTGDLGMKDLADSKRALASLAVHRYDVAVSFGKGKSRKVTRVARGNGSGNSDWLLLEVDGKGLTEGSDYRIADEPAITNATPVWYGADQFGAASCIRAKFNISTTTN